VDVGGGGGGGGGGVSGPYSRDSNKIVFFSDSCSIYDTKWQNDRNDMAEVAKKNRSWRPPHQALKLFLTTKK